MRHVYRTGLAVVGEPGFIGQVVALLDRIAADGGAGATLIRWHARPWIGIDQFVWFGRQATELRIQRYPDYTDPPGDGAVGDNRVAATSQDLGLPGRGAGSPAHINFDPAAPATAVRRPICTLVHEMTHALRIRQGLNRAEIQLGEDFDSIEEFYAILLENVFRSRQGIPLRQNHNGWVALPSPPRSYWNERNYAALFDRLFTAMPAFAADIARVEAPYNPLRDFQASPSFGTGFLPA